MNRKEECAVFQDLVELYLDKDLEQDSMEWMEKHENKCQYCLDRRNDPEALPERSNDDQEKIWSIRVVIFILYTSFVVLSIWMSAWYFW
ncbi:hypothetical protein ACFFIX_19150 [Metabacillus herbersteinensis]|uniref:Zinc-finger domain-containing protein n=1 Tax=Metabacillus herbersteinensis TaxID=283816 RepID=A0ABV6GIK0_9BACI